MKFGVLRFPGTCDEVDAQLACERVAGAEILWHGDRDLKGVDAIVVPGGFSYGDYLRVGAIARFSPLMESVIDFAKARAGPCSGICNGFQVLCEAGLLPGALLPNRTLRFVCRQVDLRVEHADTIFTNACEPGELLSIPAKHTTGCWYAPKELHERVEANGQVLLRYADGGNFNGSLARRRRRHERGRQRLRPDAAPRARGRPADRLDRRPQAVRLHPRLTGGPCLRRPSPPTGHWGSHDAEYDLIVDKLGREPKRRRAVDVLADVVGALRLQALQEAARPAAD